MMKISTKECVSKLNKQQTEIDDLKEENRQLRNQLERKNILLKVRTKDIDDRVKSFDELLNYLESFSYKSNIDANHAKQEIINIIQKWEIKRGECCKSKRFKVIKDFQPITFVDMKTGKHYDCEEVCELLNELVTKCHELIKENEQLRQSVNYWQKKYEEGTETFVSEKLNELYEENSNSD